jgi:epoxide hydrolase 4
MIENFLQALPHGITLSCRAAGLRGRPVLMFLHGFPEGAFVWDVLLEHFAKDENGGYRCVAPNLRGFEKSSAPVDAKEYRPKHLVQDIAALIAIETNAQSGQLACLVAHDWGGAVAWNLANQMPHLARRLAIVNSPHPGAFLRELKSNPKQQAASAYMNFLIRPDAEALLAEDDFRRLWKFLENTGSDAEGNSNSNSNSAPLPKPSWLTEAVKAQYREVWTAGLTGGCNLYRASPLRPPRPHDPGAAAIEMPHSMLTVSLPTLVVWALDDIALPPELIDGLDGYIADLTLKTVPGASHWIVHENPALVARFLRDFLHASPTPDRRP